MTEPARRAAGRLARLGFRDAGRAAGVIDRLDWWNAERNAPSDDEVAAIIAGLGRTADPDRALQALGDILGHPGTQDLLAALRHGSQVRARLLPLLGTSAALADHLVQHPEAWRGLVDEYDSAGLHARLARAVGADAGDPVTGSAGTPAANPNAVNALRIAYRGELVAIAGRDLSGERDLQWVSESLADLADAVLQTALAIARAALAPPSVPYRLAVIAMGKTGGRELNYVSDVDVVYVAEPGQPEQTDAAIACATRLAGEMMRICREVAWEVDANLRPEGKDGALVRTLGSHEAYYTRWASTWEFQALFKARAAAGDLGLGRRYEQVVAPFVWTAAEREEFVQDVRAMRRRVIENIPAALAPREIKLGPGGLRDVEFAVQLLQLVHGRADESLRVRGTLPALAALRDGGYVGRDDAHSLIDAYVFLRTAEHRLQLKRLRRTHVVPEDPDEVDWLGRSMGFRPDHRGGAREVFAAEWALHAREVRRLHEKLFYRPLLEAVARVPSAQLRLTPEQAGERLAALGFADPSVALRHIESLTTGLSRRAQLQRALLPAMLSDFAESPDPDRGLLAYRQVSDQLGETPWYLRLLRDGGAAASRFAYLLGTSRYVTRLLLRAPDALAMLADDEELIARSHAEAVAAMLDSARRQSSSAEAVAAIRGVRRMELLRIAFADLLGRLDTPAVCEAVSATTEATLSAVLTIATTKVAHDAGLDELPLRFAIIAMGRLGGAEVGYGSDADVMFVYEPTGEEQLAGTLARTVAETVRSLLASPSAADPPLAVDADLRPEGRNGPLVRTLHSYRQYYERWSSPWEAQALLRARCCAGDSDLGDRFLAMIDAVRYPDGGLAQDELREIRRVKARVDSERLPRGADPSTHTKLGRGGLTDVEWTVQLLQLEHGHALPALRTPRTLGAIEAARKEGLLQAGQAEALRAAWTQATRVRNALMLVRDKAEDQLPGQGRALLAIGRAMGYPPGTDPGQVLDDYRRTARHARTVVEDVFYGPIGPRNPPEG